MSGQLVGEVLDAAEAGHLDNLSRGDVLALVTIAEKCHTATRQGSIRMSRIQAAMACSRTTAWRAVRKLTDRGLVRVVKYGYKSHGNGHANIYELAVLVSPKMKHAPQDACADACFTQDETCNADVHVSNPDVHVSNPAGACFKSADECFTQDETHDGTDDGTDDGTNDGSGARKRAPAPRGTRLPADWKPSPDVIAQQRADHPHLSLDEILDDFRDYWQAKTGKDATKLDWLATWRRWVRKEASQSRRAGPPPRDGPSAYERKTAHNYAVFQSLGDDDPTPPPGKELER